MNAPAALTTILAPGPVESKAVLAAMVVQGFTAKQTRRARESLGLIVHRAGYGPQTQSTWQLPTSTCSTPDETAPVVPADGRASSSGKMLGFVGVSEPSARVRRVRSGATSGAAPVRSVVRAEVPAVDVGMTADEKLRTERRVVLFLERGADAQEARLTALALVQRDRTKPQQWGSCVECQNYVRRQCPVEQRPIAEVHECWLRRHDAS